MCSSSWAHKVLFNNKEHVLPVLMDKKQRGKIKTTIFPSCIYILDLLPSQILDTRTYEDPSAIWMKAVFKGVSRQRQQVEVLLFKSMKCEVSSFLLEIKHFVGPTSICRYLTISLFWFIIKHKGNPCFGL